MHDSRCDVFSPTGLKRLTYLELDPLWETDYTYRIQIDPVDWLLI